MKSINYIIAGVASFIIGLLIVRSKSFVPSNFNKTIAVNEGNRYFLYYKGPVELSREINKEIYDQFYSLYPEGKANGNVINSFSEPSNRYSYENGKYFEYIWTGNKYSMPVEISKDEYSHFTKDKIIPILSDSIIF